MQGLKRLGIAGFVLGVSFVVPTMATVQNFLSFDDLHNEDEIHYGSLSPSLAYQSNWSILDEHMPSFLDENKLSLDSLPVSCFETTNAINNVFQAEGKDTFTQKGADSSFFYNESPFVCGWVAPNNLNPTLTRTLAPFNEQMPVPKQQKKANNATQNFPSNLLSPWVRKDIKERLKDTFCMLNTLSNQDRFFTLEEITDILHTETMLFNKPYTSPQKEVLYQMILDDPELKELYENRQRLERDYNSVRIKQAAFNNK